MNDRLRVHPVPREQTPPSSVSIAQPQPSPQPTPVPAVKPAPDQKKPVASATSEESLQADINAIVRKRYFPDMPDEVAKRIEKKAT